MANEILQNAIDLLRAGRKIEARKILEPYINENLHDTQAWLLEAQARETPSEKGRVLQMGLDHNPDYKQIKDAIIELKANRDRSIPANVKQLSKPSKSSRLTNGIFALLILALLFSQGWLFYKVQNLERTSRLIQADLSSTQTQLSSVKTQLASSQSQLSSTNVQLASLQSQFNVLASELGQVSAIASHADKYAHCHPNAGVPCY